MDIPLKLEDYLKTLSEASFDDKKKETLIDSDCPVYKLDTITVQVCKALQRGDPLSGCDAYLGKRRDILVYRVQKSGRR